MNNLIKSLALLILVVASAPTLASNNPASELKVEWLGHNKVSICEPSQESANCVVITLPKAIKKIDDVIALQPNGKNYVRWLVRSDSLYRLCAAGNGNRKASCVKVPASSAIKDYFLLHVGSEWHFNPKRGAKPVDAIPAARKFFSSVERSEESLVERLESGTQEADRSSSIVRLSSFDEEGDHDEEAEDSSSGEEASGGGNANEGVPDESSGNPGSGNETCVSGPVTVCVWGHPPSVPDEPAPSGTVGGSICDIFGTCNTAPPPPPPPPEQECSRLNSAVQDAKSVTGSLGKCRAGMSQYELYIRKNAWLDEASARAKRDQKCWEGGDAGHQQAQAQAWQNAATCGNLAN